MFIPRVGENYMQLFWAEKRHLYLTNKKRQQVLQGYKNNPPPKKNSHNTREWILEKDDIG